MTTPSAELAVPLAAALGIGLLIGLERERKKGVGPRRGAAGLRTFATTSLLGFTAMLLGSELLVGVALLAVLVLAATAYVVNRDDDPGITTEMAQLMTLLLGALCVAHAGIAVAIAVILAVLLAYRSVLHDFSQKYLSETELHDGLILAAAVMVVLPIVPDRYIGPFAAINLQILWKLTVLMMSISAAGHVATRLLGSRRGLALSGLVSGFVSSTATIASMGALARRDESNLKVACMSGMLSSVATPVQMCVLLAAVNTDLLKMAVWPLLAGGVAALAYSAVFMSSAAEEKPGFDVASEPVFSLKVALLLVTAIAGISLLSASLLSIAGEKGLSLAAALGGLVDAHSSVVSIGAMAAAGKVSTLAALSPVLFSISTNTLSKGVVAWSSGGRRFFERIIPGLVLSLAAIWVVALLSTDAWAELTKSVVGVK